LDCRVFKKVFLEPENLVFELFFRQCQLATEIAGLDNDGPTKMQGRTLQGWTL